METCEKDRLSRAGICARLHSLPFVPLLDILFSSKYYFILIGALTVFGNLFSAELFVYTVFIALGVCICLFGRDLLPLMPIVICCYIVPSRENNPGICEDSIFYPGHGGIYLIVIASVFVAALLFRLLTDPQIGRKNFIKLPRELMGGIMFLGCAYLLSGTLSGYSSAKNLLFAALQFAAILIPYYLFAGGVKWDKAQSRYVAWTGMCVGFSVLIELLFIYATCSPIVGSEIDRNVIYTGWGNYNNMGGMLVMALPFAFQLGCIKKKSWLYSFCGAVFLIGIFLSCSRTSILVGLVIFAGSVMELFIHSRYRRICIRSNLLAFGLMLAFVLIFYYDVFLSYLEIFSIERSIHSRFAGYEEGLAQFMKYPLFGGSFYTVEYTLEEWSKLDSFTSFFPARWHNTPVQLLASCGLVGMLAYSVHRIQTIYLIMRKQNLENVYISLSALGLLMTSLFDCHFFNIGPMLLYSMMLAFAEKYDPATGIE